MYPKLNIIVASTESKNSIEGKKVNTNNITKLTNNQYSNSLKTPFSNLILRKMMIHQKIKSLNQMKKRNKDDKKKSFKQNNLYLNFSDFHEPHLKNKNENIYETNNTSNIIKTTRDKIISYENNYIKSLGSEAFSSRGKIFKNRNIRPLKLFLPAGKTLNNIKIKSYSNRNKENSNKKIVFLYNKMLKINKMNLTINNLPNLFHIDEKTNRNTKNSFPEIKENKIYANKRKQNIIFKHNIDTNIINNSNSIKTAQISIYEKNNPKLLFKNKINNSLSVNNNENHKNISHGQIDNNIYNSFNIFQKEKINNFGEKTKKGDTLKNNFNTNPLSCSNRVIKKKYSTIYKLLKLKNKNENNI